MNIDRQAAMNSMDKKGQIQNMDMLQIDSLCKKLGNFQFNNISFSLPPGYLCGLIGPNGAGKTTLLHMILGLYRVDTGSILVDGMDYQTKEKQIHDRIGIALAEDLMNPSMTLIQNGDWYGKYYSQYCHAALSHYLVRFGLDEKRRFGSLSNGEKLKCQFAFALSHHASLLLLDEPAGNFDPGFREQFLQMIREFVQDGTGSVILATHITQDLDRMADYILYLENGNCVFAGDIESLHERYRMVSGEAYKIKLLPKEKFIYLEENQYGAKALVRHSRLNRYDASLKIAYPTIEELMYFYAQGKMRK